MIICYANIMPNKKNVWQSIKKVSEKAFFFPIVLGSTWCQSNNVTCFLNTLTRLTNIFNLHPGQNALNCVFKLINMYFLCRFWITSV